MFCKKCGKQLSEDSRFCPNCGERVEIIEESKPVEPEIVQTDEEKEPRGPWKAFAIAGFAIGIFSIIGCMIPYVNLYVISVGEIGIALSALGLKSKINHDKAKTGLVLGIIGLAVAIFMYIVFIILAAFFEIAIFEDFYIEIFEELYSTMLLK